MFPRYKIRRFEYSDGRIMYQVLTRIGMFPFHYASEGMYSTVEAAEKRVKDLAGWPRVRHWGCYDKDGDEIA